MNKTAALIKTITLYNACKGIYRVKAAGIRDALMGTHNVLAKVTGPAGAVLGPIYTAQFALGIGSQLKGIADDEIKWRARKKARLAQQQQLQQSQYNFNNDNQTSPTSQYNNQV